MHPLTLNPAMTGFLNGDCRAGVMYRNQWKSVTVPFLQYQGRMNTSLLENGDQFGAGLVVASDKSGDEISTSPKYTFQGPIIKS